MAHMPQTCSGFMSHAEHYPHVHLITILFLWCLQSKQPVSAGCSSCLPLRCHSTRLLQRHNDADCAMSMQQVKGTHDKGILFRRGNGHYWPHSVNAVRAAHLQSWNNVGYCHRHKQENQSGWWTDTLPRMLFHCRVSTTIIFLSLTGLEQQFLQELLALRVPQQYRGRPELSGGPFLRPLPVPRDTQAQQKAAAQLPVPPLLQQRPLHQRLPSGEPVSGAVRQSGAETAEHCVGC